MTVLSTSKGVGVSEIFNEVEPANSRSNYAKGPQNRQIQKAGSQTISASVSVPPSQLANAEGNLNSLDLLGNFTERKIMRSLSPNIIRHL